MIHYGHVPAAEANVFAPGVEDKISLQQPADT
jgi:hypothetical protein